MVSGLLLLSDGTMHLRSVEDELNEWYTLLGCSMIETVSIRVKRCPGVFTVICDEEGRLNGNDTPMIYSEPDADKVMHPLIVGNCFICKTSPDGEFISLTTEDASALMNCIRAAEGVVGSVRPILTDASFA